MTCSCRLRGNSVEERALVLMRNTGIGNRIILPNEVIVESNQSKTVCKHSFRYFHRFPAQQQRTRFKLESGFCRTCLLNNLTPRCALFSTGIGRMFFRVEGFNGRNNSIGHNSLNCGSDQWSQRRLSWSQLASWVSFVNGTMSWTGLDVFD